MLVAEFYYMMIIERGDWTLSSENSNEENKNEATMICK